MSTVFLRFYEELNDFLPAGKRKKQFAQTFWGAPTAGEIICLLGVPLKQVDLLLVNGESADFSRSIQDGDRLGVFPVFESLDIGPATRLPSRPLRRTRFVLDVHLGKLARKLRLLGFDSFYRNDGEDGDLVSLAEREERILLTRDRRLLEQKSVVRGYRVRAENPDDQAVEILCRLDLVGSVRPFTICMECNSPLEPVEKSAIAGDLPPKIRRDFDLFYRCPDCKRNYWRGSHFENMRRFVEDAKRRAEEKLTG